MNIITIPLRCLRQKWGRSAALLSVFLLGVAAITALNNVSSSVAEGFEKKLSAFGANIAITPKRETLQISYGGIPLGNATVDNGYIPLAETQRAIEGIPLRDRISVVAPKLAGLVSFAAKAGEAPVLVPLVGVNFESEVELKQFWHARGSIPGVATMQIPDPLMQRLEEQHARHAAQADAPGADLAGTTSPEANMAGANRANPDRAGTDRADADRTGEQSSGNTALAGKAGGSASGMEAAPASSINPTSLPSPTNPSGQSEGPAPSASGMQTDSAASDDYSAFFADIAKAQQFLYAPGPIDPNVVSAAAGEDDCCAGIMDDQALPAGQPGQTSQQGHGAPLSANVVGQVFNPARADMGHAAMLDAARPDGQGGDHTAPDGQHAAPQHPDQGLTPARSLLAGATVAERLKLGPGQTIWLNDAQYLVEGVLQPTGSDDDSVLFAHMAEAQKLFHAPDAASFIEVAALCSGCPIEDIVNELGASLPGQDIRALRQVVAQRMYSISFAQNMALVVTVVILFSACVMVVMSMLVSVNERRKEIGLLRAVGFSRRAVFFIFAAEALVIGFLAGVAGYAAGYFAGSKVLVAMQIEAAAYPAFSFAALFGYGLMASALAVLASAFPACKAARANPAEALTSL